MRQTILVIAAHPDDEILGCGGTLAKHARDGDLVYGLILGEGKTSRDQHDKNELLALKDEAESSAKIIGIKQLFFADFPDNQFDSIPLLSIVKRIEEIKNKVKPSIIYTHHFGDMNIDHTLTHRAVMTATRPQPGEVVKSIYAFETPSSTEWNSYERNNVFVPNYFVDIASTLATKLKALAEYRSELHDYPHPRSLGYVQKLAELSGAKIGLPACESFALIRQLEDSI